MIDKKQIQHLAKLSRLNLSEEELQKYQIQISDILNFVGQLQKADVGQLPSSLDQKEIVLREDVAQIRSLEEQARLLKQVPDKDKQFIKTQGIFES